MSTLTEHFRCCYIYIIWRACIRIDRYALRNSDDCAIGALRVVKKETNRQGVRVKKCSGGATSNCLAVRKNRRCCGQSVGEKICVKVIDPSWCAPRCSLPVASARVVGWPPVEKWRSRKFRKESKWTLTIRDLSPKKCRMGQVPPPRIKIPTTRLSSTSTSSCREPRHTKATCLPWLFETPMQMSRERVTSCWSCSCAFARDD